MPEVFLRMWLAVRSRIVDSQKGQTTAEYMLVLGLVAAVVLVAIAWATQGTALKRLFNSAVDEIIPG